MKFKEWIKLKKEDTSTGDVAGYHMPLYGSSQPFFKEKKLKKRCKGCRKFKSKD